MKDGRPALGIPFEPMYILVKFSAEAAIAWSSLDRSRIDLSLHQAMWTKA